MICIYHSRDFDGWCSAAIVKRKYPDVKLVGFDYGEKLPMEKIPAGEPIIMIDVSLPMPEMASLSTHSGQMLTWVDHHISAINDFRNYKDADLSSIIAILESGVAACEGAWKYLLPEESMPLAVSLLGQYDTWRNQDKKHWNENVLPFQFGMKSICSSPETFPMELLYDLIDTKNYISGIINNGAAIMRYQEQMDAFKCKREAFEYEFEGLRTICLNTQGGGSNTFKSVYDEAKHDIMMPFQFNGKQWIISMYTTKNIDCSVIAKKYGGGGHAKACGFQVDDIRTIFTIIK